MYSVLMYEIDKMTITPDSITMDDIRRVENGLWALINTPLSRNVNDSGGGGGRGAREPHERLKHFGAKLCVMRGR